MIETYIVDSFTDTPFKGNPAGVCLLKNELKEDLMLSIAKELGLSETAFVLKKNEVFSIRYFSPKMEIPLCGHATLASAKVLFEKDKQHRKIVFRTIEDVLLTTTLEGARIEMQFPIYDTVTMEAPKDLLTALGVETCINSEYNKETKILVIEIEDSTTLRQLAPDFEKLIRSHNAINGVLLTAKSQDDCYDFESRYFWPWSGTNEDPVTGGTHTFLSKYWSERLAKKKMQSFQCSERSGFMEVELLSDTIVAMRSQAQIVFRGQLML